MKEYTEYKVKVYEDRTEWYNSKNQLHRLNGPAREWANGYKAWYQNDKLHRLNGHAVQWPNGSKHWYIEGKEYTEEQFNKFNNSCDGKEVEIDGQIYQLKLK